MMSEPYSTPLFSEEETSPPDSRKTPPEPGEGAPLAFHMAPRTFDDFVGQEHILGEGKPLRRLIENDQLFSIILWGPPGCGKTALSRLISYRTKAAYIALNAVTAKIADIKDAIDTARAEQRRGRKTILFLDEIHRFNKAQQDALLPEVESGLLTLIGATTENPFFSVIPALISRSQVFEFKPLESKDLLMLIDRFYSRETEAGNRGPALTEDAKEYLVRYSGGDARKLFNLLEMALKSSTQTITKDHMESLTQVKGTTYDEDDHYDIISAFIKSMRGSDPDAAVYWLARMLKGGEDPEFIARRLIIFASEDVGNADPQALILAVALLEAVKFIGMPEIRINLSHVTTYLACAPKSNASYAAINRAFAAIDNGTLFAVPNHLRDSHYKGAKRMGFGKGYKYPHDYPPYAITDQDYLPESRTFYEPKDIGYEKQLKKRLEFIRSMKQSKGAPPL